ncbi:DUF3011 domain-containing protein [Sphingosinicellaceae bacterium]|nr:DUF3011 domain-containing protein [Sphingosinicellaceae bacterium]
MLRLTLIAAFALASLAPLPALAQNGYQGGGQGSDDGYQRGNRDDDRRGPGGGYVGGGQRTIVCESYKHKSARCDVDTRGGVRLVQQTHGNCIQGRSWGFDRGGIWVNDSCRAVFSVNAVRPGGPGGFPPANLPGGGNGRIIACNSMQYQPARCAGDVYRGADLVQDISGRCQRRNWGWDRGGVWVNNGCRGTFRVY